MNQPKKLGVGPVSLFLGLLVVAAVGVWSLSETAVMAEKSAPAEAGEEVLAIVGGEEVTLAEVEAANSAQFKALERQRRELIEQVLDGFISERLIEIEAEERGVSADELVAAEVDGKAPIPSDEQINAFYEERKDRINQPLEAVADQIKQYLRQQDLATARTSFLEGLRDKHETRILLEPIRIEVAEAEAPSKGPEDAPVTIVEFSDFQCPYCSRVVPTLDKVAESFGDQVRIVFRQFPLNNIHPQAQKAAEASLCADDQGRFWEMHDTMFQEQKALGLDQLKEKALRLELDMDRFNECLDSGRYADRVAADLQAGSEAGVQGTPAMFINGRFLNGAQPYEQIAQIIKDELRRLEVE
jgi:predicted DsbA family dithiol-disulfide isomerase